MGQGPRDERRHRAPGHRALGIVVDVQGGPRGIDDGRDLVGAHGDAQLPQSRGGPIDARRAEGPNIREIVVSLSGGAAGSQHDHAVLGDRDVRRGLVEEAHQEDCHVGARHRVVGPVGARLGDDPVGGELVDRVPRRRRRIADVGEARVHDSAEVHARGLHGSGDEQRHLPAGHVVAGRERGAVAGADSDPMVGDAVDGVAKDVPFGHVREHVIGLGFTRTRRCRSQVVRRLLHGRGRVHPHREERGDQGTHGERYPARAPPLHQIRHRRLPHPELTNRSSSPASPASSASSVCVLRHRTRGAADRTRQRFGQRSFS